MLIGKLMRVFLSTYQQVTLFIWNNYIRNKKSLDTRDNKNNENTFPILGV